MSALSDDKSRLITGAARHGFSITSKKLDRWRSDGLLPKPEKYGRGRGQGIERRSSEETLKQLLALCSILQKTRNLDHAAFRLWIMGFPIALQRVRRAIENLVIQPVKRLQRESQKALEECHNAAERTIRRKSVRPRVRELARNGQLAEMLSTMMKFTLGQGNSISENERIKFIKNLEDAAALDSARTQTPNESTQPWLSGSISKETMDVLGMTHLLVDLYSQATEEMLEQKRSLFLQWEHVIAWAQRIQEIYGPEAFGFAVLTDGLIGVDPFLHGPLIFVGFFLLERLNPDLDAKVHEVSNAAQSSLEIMNHALQSFSIAERLPININEPKGNMLGGLAPDAAL